MKSPDSEKRVETLWDAAKASGLSRRRFLALLSTGGAVAVLTAIGPTRLAGAQTAQPTPGAQPVATPGIPGLAEGALVEPSGERLHVKVLPEKYFVVHGTSVEMDWATKRGDPNYRMDSSQFFVRNHTATPIIDPGQWRLRVAGNAVGNPLELTYDQLMDLPSRTVTRYVECAGNGRAFYDIVLGEPGQGTQWRAGGYGIGEWTGVPLSEILDRAGATNAAVSIMAAGLDGSGFKKPLPIDKARQDDTMVVYGMNGGPLPYDHGFPARLLVPGWAGSFNVKWLGLLDVADSEQYSTWNTSSYVLIGPEYADPPGPPEGEVITSQTVKSAVALPWPATLQPGSQTINGYAWSPFASIARVEVSTDDGETWQRARLRAPNMAAAGVRWEHTFNAQPGDLRIMTRATDRQGNAQWPVEEQVWNEKGYNWGAIIPHPVTVSS